MKNKRGYKGYTLVELLVTIGLIAAVATLMYTFLGQGFTLYTKQNEASQEQMNMRQVLSDITNRARLADPDDISYEDGTLHVGDKEYSFNSANKEILRDGTTLATGIDSFTVSLNNDLLEISITSTADTTVSTSLYLVQ